MSALVKHLSRYTGYHRNRRNVTSHMIGVPLIVLGVEALLSRLQWQAGPLAVSPAFVTSVAAAIFYVGLDAMLGMAMVIYLSLGVVFGRYVAALPTGIWISVAGGGFIAGWIIQFVGHSFERRKPAFLDDLAGLVIGPLFVMAEAAFSVGCRRKLKEEVEASLCGLSAGVAEHAGSPTCASRSANP